MKSLSDEYPEIIIGLVAPIGTNLELLLGNNEDKENKEPLKEEFKSFNYDPEVIKVTELINLKSELKKSRLKTKEIKGLIEESSKLIKSYKGFNYYFKMELCSALRQKYGVGYFGAKIAEKIKKMRDKKTKNKKNKMGKVYFIDQLKNTGEQEVLEKLYGENYIQISCFSSYINRDKNIKEKCHKEKFLKKDVKNEEKILTNILNKIEPKSLRKIALNFESMFSDFIHKLMKKDSEEIDVSLSKKDFDTTKRRSHGQEISKLYHKSHFFINLDSQDIEKQINKIVKVIFGKYDEFPSQDEFGMAIAYVASKRSNFPGDRHIGASILSEDGEVLSVGEIRAPVPHSNPERCDQNVIEEGYNNYTLQKKELLKWVEDLVKKCDKQLRNPENEEHLKKWLNDSLDFHPCTHAEMSAIADAAKIGISIRNATLYTTTFPCHLCAKDIITCAIKRVVFLEAYPKSKNDKLYAKILDFDSSEHRRLETVPFDSFFGVGPRKYNYYYSLENKKKSTIGPPLLNGRLPFIYLELEKKLISCIRSKKPSIVLFKEYFDKEESNKKQKKSRKEERGK